MGGSYEGGGGWGIQGEGERGDGEGKTEEKRGEGGVESDKRRFRRIIVSEIFNNNNIFFQVNYKINLFLCKLTIKRDLKFLWSKIF